MKRHRYRITVEHIPEPGGDALVSARPLQFEIENHDDIFSAVERLRQRGDFGGDTAAAFGVGLKLFSEVMLENRSHPLFAFIAPHFRAFMAELKKGAR